VQSFIYVRTDLPSHVTHRAITNIALSLNTERRINVGLKAKTHWRGPGVPSYVYPFVRRELPHLVRVPPAPRIMIRYPLFYHVLYNNYISTSSIWDN
jgi:hypothetical protein